jgi:CDP-glucose 4,6-dehydratase
VFRRAGAGHKEFYALDPEARFAAFDRLRLADALQWTVDWHRSHKAGADMRGLCLSQIAAYEKRASV